MSALTDLLRLTTRELWNLNTIVAGFGPEGPKDYAPEAAKLTGEELMLRTDVSPRRIERGNREAAERRMGGVFG